MEQTKEVVKLRTFDELRLINCNEFVEKKGSLSYLSWTNAIEILLQNDPTATWEFFPPTMFGESMMINCKVNAFGRSHNMHLPVMDNKNQAIKNPDARKVSDSMMRCLAKCIACFGIGLYIYKGDDLPEQDVVDLTLAADKWIDAINECGTIDLLKAVFGQAYTELSKDKNAVELISQAKDKRKGELA